MPPPTDLPICLKSSPWYWVKWWGIALLIAIPIVTWESVFDPGHIVDNLLHSGEVKAFGEAFIILGLLIPVFWRQSILAVTADGIEYRAAPGKYFYAWRDIERVDQVKAGATLIVHGMSDLRNRYNVIPAAFGVTPQWLVQLFRDGIDRYAAAPIRSDIRTVSQGESAIAIDARQSRGIVRVIAIAAGLAMLGFAINFAVDYRQGLELRAHGERIAGHVVRFYLDSCSRHGCTTDVEYSYRVPSEGRWQVFRGHVTIAGYAEKTNLRLASSLDVVPIVYDTMHPGVSVLNYGDHVFRKTAWDDNVFTLVLGCMIIALVVGFFALFWLSTRGVRRLQLAALETDALAPRSTTPTR